MMAAAAPSVLFVDSLASLKLPPVQLPPLQLLPPPPVVTPPTLLRGRPRKKRLVEKPDDAYEPSKGSDDDDDDNDEDEADDDDDKSAASDLPGPVTLPCKRRAPLRGPKKAKPPADPNANVPAHGRAAVAQAFGLLAQETPTSVGNNTGDWDHDAHCWAVLHVALNSNLQFKKTKSGELLTGELNFARKNDGWARYFGPWARRSYTQLHTHLQKYELRGLTAPKTSRSTHSALRSVVDDAFTHAPAHAAFLSTYLLCLRTKLSAYNRMDDLFQLPITLATLDDHVQFHLYVNATFVSYMTAWHARFTRHESEKVPVLRTLDRIKTKLLDTVQLAAVVAAYRTIKKTMMQDLKIKWTDQYLDAKVVVDGRLVSAFCTAPWCKDRVADEPMATCKMPACGNRYHVACLKCKQTGIDPDRFYCHTDAPSVVSTWCHEMGIDDNDGIDLVTGQPVVFSADSSKNFDMVQQHVWPHCLLFENELDDVYKRLTRFVRIILYARVVRILYVRAIPLLVYDGSHSLQFQNAVTAYTFDCPSRPGFKKVVYSAIFCRSFACPRPLFHGYDDEIKMCNHLGCMDAFHKGCWSAQDAAGNVYCKAHVADAVVVDDRKPLA
jgi:hypothetical protein